jgi:exonuclease VII small subunit
MMRDWADSLIPPFKYNSAIKSALLQALVGPLETAPETPETAPESLETAPETLETAPESLERAPESLETAIETLERAPETPETAVEKPRRRLSLFRGLKTPFGGRRKLCQEQFGYHFGNRIWLIYAGNGRRFCRIPPM